MSELEEYCTASRLDAAVKELDAALVEMYEITRVATDTGYLSRQTREGFVSSLTLARKRAREIDSLFLEWRRDYNFDPTYEGLHAKVGYLHRTDSRGRRTAATADVVSEKQHRKYRRQAQKNLGQARRWLWAVPEPFNSSSPLTEALFEIDDVTDFPKRLRAVRKRSKRLNVRIGAILYAIRGDHNNGSGIGFAFRQALAVGSSVKIRTRR